MKSLLAFLVVISPILHDGNWDLKKDRNNIKVYTKHVEASKMKAIKAICVIDAPLNTCVAVLRDVEHLNELFPDCQKASKVEQSCCHQIHYLELDAPWPVSDRDGAYKLDYEYNAEEDAVLINAKTVPDRYPIQDKFVRLTEGTGTWKFKRLSPTQTEVHYFYHGDPGGNIPEWLANSVVEESPFNMFLNFQKLVKLERYQGQEFDFIQ